MDRRKISIFISVLLISYSVFLVSSSQVDYLLPEVEAQASPLFGSEDNMLWNQTYGGSSADAGSSVQVTSDGGYIITGGTRSFGAGDLDVYLVRTDSDGNMLWNQTYGGTGDDQGFSVQVTPDGGYIIVGYTNSFGTGWFDVYLVKTDSEGNMLWNKTYGGTSPDAGLSVQVTPDGGYIITGNTNSFGAENFDVYLIRTDSDGNILWDQSYGGAGDDQGFSVQVTTDGGYVITGYSQSFGMGDYDIYLVKTDSEGNILWSQTYGGRSDDIGNSVQLTLDGGYIITGYTWSFGSNSQQVYLVKTDSEGNLLWHQNYGGPNIESGFSVQVTLDGGYIITGEITISTDNSDVYLVKTDSEGNLVWDQNYGGPSFDRGRSVQVNSEGSYIIAGETWKDNDDWDVYLVKIGPNSTTTTTSTTSVTQTDTETTVSPSTDTSSAISLETIAIAAGIAVVVIAIALGLRRRANQ